jgi:transposase
LLPVDVRDLLPADHRAWQVQRQIGELDLSGFEAAYRVDGRGRPPHHPRAMLGLIVYCYGKRLRSGREIAAACVDDLGARMLMAGQCPNRTTVDRFLDLHADAIRAVLPQTLAMGEVEGLVDVRVVAGDGTKVIANAAMGACTDEAGLRAQIADLERQVEATTAAWDAQVAASCPDQDATTSCAFGHLLLDLDGEGDPESHGDLGRDGGDQSTWRRLGVLTRLLRDRQAALAYLLEHPPAVALAEWQEQLSGDTDRVARCRQRIETLRARLQAAWDERQRALAAGKVFRGPPMVPVQNHSQLRREQKALATATTRAAATAAARPAATRVNTTDPHSRIMPGKHDGFDQRYNVQALACKNQFILAIGTHDSPNDKQALRALLAAARANLDAAGILRTIEIALFDSGYASEANFTADLPVDTLLVAVEKEARQTARLRDDVSTAAAAWQAMADTLTDPDNAALYKRRAAIIEPVFAQLFQHFGRDLNRRGEAVETELHLWAITHNLDKIARTRRKQRRPG